MVDNKKDDHDKRELSMDELEMVTGGCQHMVVPLDDTIPGGSQIQNPAF